MINIKKFFLNNNKNLSKKKLVKLNYFIILINTFFFLNYYNNNFLEYPYLYNPIINIFLIQTITIIALINFFFFIRLYLISIFVCILNLTVFVSYNQNELLQYIFIYKKIFFLCIFLLSVFFLYAEKINLLINKISNLVFIFLSFLIISNFIMILSKLDVKNLLLNKNFYYFGDLVEKNYNTIKEPKNKKNIYFIIPDSFPAIEILDEISPNILTKLIEIENYNIKIEKKHSTSKLETFDFLCSFLSGKYHFLNSENDCMKIITKKSRLLQNIQDIGYSLYFVESGQGYPYTFCKNENIDQCFDGNKHSAWEIHFIRNSTLKFTCPILPQGICYHTKRMFNNFFNPIRHNWDWSRPHLMVLHSFQPHDPIFYDKNCAFTIPDLNYQKNYENEIKCVVDDIKKTIQYILNKNKDNTPLIFIYSDAGLYSNNIIKNDKKTNIEKRSIFIKSFAASNAYMFCDQKIPKNSEAFLKFAFNCLDNKKMDIVEPLIQSFPTQLLFSK